jgi:hypothetical protein
MNGLEGGGCFGAAVASLREHNVPIIVGPMEIPTPVIWPPCAIRMGTS